jgi:uncharacterized protein (UPF0548 family)
MTRRPAAEGVLDAVVQVGSMARWGVGMPIAAWRYATRPVPIVRAQETVAGIDHGPADRPVPGDQAPLQPRSDGDGPAMRRVYRVNITNPRMTATELMTALCRDPNVASPFEVARFVKTSGRLGEMVAGDEYLVWMLGPWNGPVRVADRTPTSFRLATLKGHMEAGEIEFRVRDVAGHMVFEIESAARSGTHAFWLFYGPLWVAKEGQLHMWASFCERAARLAGDPATVIEVRTRRFPDDHGRPVNRTSRRARRALTTLKDRPINFEHESLDDASPDDGWIVDDHCTSLGREASGPPTQAGPFSVARDLVRDYEFADPRLIRAIYDPSEPLENRSMLLEGRFLGLRFLLGVRVVRIVDDVSRRDGRLVQRWGWSYRTLKGHLETGHMDFDVLKWCDTGEVEFRIHAVSRPARIPNPVVRAGFRIFGRRLQLRFARVAGERMQHLVAERLVGETGRDEAPAPAVQSVAPSVE